MMMVPATAMRSQPTTYHEHVWLAGKLDVGGRDLTNMTAGPGSLRCMVPEEAVIGIWRMMCKNVRQ